MLIKFSIFIHIIDVYGDKNPSRLNFTSPDEYELRRCNKFVEKEPTVKKKPKFRFEDRMNINLLAYNTAIAEKMENDNPKESATQKRMSIVNSEKQKNKSSKNLIHKITSNQKGSNEISEFKGEEEEDPEEIRRRNVIRSHTKKLTSIKNLKGNISSSIKLLKIAENIDTSRDNDDNFMEVINSDDTRELNRKYSEQI